MNKIKRILTAGTIAFMAMALISGQTPAAAPEAPRKAVFTRPLVWRSDSLGLYTFKGTILAGAKAARDGSVVSGASQGSCELPDFYKTDGLITALTANWAFTGKVKLEVSITGKSKDYVPVTNGVPLVYEEKAYGSRIKWKASLAPNSSLTELKITYFDLSGVAGSFGNELLSGFGARKQISIKGSSAGNLFNYQIPVKVGESREASAPCDVKLDGGILSDFADIRFTQADGETLLPHYTESVTGAVPKRVAAFWVKIPEIPKGGLPIYIYYGKPNAAELSDGEKVFDFFDGFDGAALSDKKWKVTKEADTGKAYLQDSSLSLYMAKATTADYKFASGLIEYKTGIADGGAAVGIIRGARTSGDELIAYSSASGNSSHCIAKGISVKANDPKPIASGIFYLYSIYCDDKGDLAFRRYGADGSGKPQAEIKYAAGASGASPIGLSPSNQARELQCQWIRVRNYADPAPEVDLERTASSVSEAVNLPEFDNVATSPGGSLVPAPNNMKGYYTSRLISPAFEARMIRPSWKVDLADGLDIGVSIATKKNGAFYSGWLNGIARYASKKEFDKGNQLRWKAEFSGELPVKGAALSGGSAQGMSLKNFSLEFQPGTIRVILPNGGEAIKAGSKYNIFWEVPGYDKTYPLEISFLRPDNKEFEVIAPRVDNTGDYAWDVPNIEVQKALVKIADAYDGNIYGISEGYFSVSQNVEASEGQSVKVSGGDEAVPVIASEPKASEAISKDKAKNLAGIYELLIKLDERKPGAKKATAGNKGFYEEGDIVMIKPAGYIWGSEEKGSKFVIVQARLSAQEAKDFMSPKEMIVDKKDVKGGRVTRIDKKRRFKIDLVKQGIMNTKGAVLKSASSGEPVLLAREAVEEKK